LNEAAMSTFGKLMTVLGVMWGNQHLLQGRVCVALTVSCLVVVVSVL